jgi:hypothetical protein
MVGSRVKQAFLSPIPARHIAGTLAALWIVAHVLLLFSGWPTVTGILILGVLLPGTLAAAWLLHRVFPTALEFALYSLGLGYTLYMLTLLALSVVPGGLASWHVVVALDMLCLLLALGWWRTWRLPSVPSGWQPPDATWDRWAVVGLLSVLGTGALLRLLDLGYSEFLFDEIRVMHLSAEVIQGYPSALLLHRKGPAEILIPTGIYAVQQSITEAHARFPFALANLVGLAAIYLLGWRIFGKVAGWTAAMLLAVDGFFIAFARFTQYQSIVFLMSTLIVLALHRYAQRQTRNEHLNVAYLWIAGLCFVAGIYSHYEAIWVVIPGLYLLWVYSRRSGDWRGLLRAAIGPLLVTLGLILAFYVPFVLDTNWQATADNLFGKRIGNDFPYNNLADFFDRATIYDATYQILFLVLSTVFAQALVLWRHWPRNEALLAIVVTIAGLAATFLVSPAWLRMGETDHTWLFFTLAAGAVVVTPRLPHDERAIWLWFALSMLISLFGIAEPNTHVYTFFMGWVLVVGYAMENGWQGLRSRMGLPTARGMALAAATLVFAIFANYAFWFFAYTPIEILRTWSENRLWGYWTPYELPNQDSIYGFPFKNGWKVIGALYADGTLDAPFDTYESSRIVDWYSRGPHICPPDAEYYMVPTKLQPNEQFEIGTKLDELAALNYQEWGYVTINGDTRLRIFSKHPVQGAPHVFDEADYAPIFDKTLSSPYFVKAGPALLVEPTNDVDYRLGDSIWLKGYSLPQSSVEAGSTISLDLYWQATEYQEGGDKTFVQIINLDTLHKAAQRDSEPGCDKYTLEDWRPGDLNYDPYTLTIAPDTPPGNYTVLVGLYDEETEERYPVFAADGAAVGDSIALTTLEVVHTP